jgi:hypothetical protein
LKKLLNEEDWNEARQQESKNERLLEDVADEWNLVEVNSKADATEIEAACVLLNANLQTHLGRE